MVDESFICDSGLVLVLTVSGDWSEKVKLEAHGVNRLTAVQGLI